jgi:hypothetical protein
LSIVFGNKVIFCHKNSISRLLPKGDAAHLRGREIMSPTNQFRITAASPVSSVASLLQRRLCRGDRAIRRAALGLADR